MPKDEGWIVSFRGGVDWPTLATVGRDGSFKVVAYPHLASTSAPPDKRGFNGLARHRDGQLVAASWDKLVQLGTDNMLVARSWSNQWMSDCHGLTIISDEEFVITSTNISSVLFGNWGKVRSQLHIHEILGLGRRNFGTNDYRRHSKNTSPMYDGHLVGCQRFGGFWYLTFMSDVRKLIDESESTIPVVDLTPENLRRSADLGGLIVLDNALSAVLAVVSGGLHEGTRMGSKVVFPEYQFRSLIEVDEVNLHIDRLNLNMKSNDVDYRLSRGILADGPDRFGVLHPPVRGRSDVAATLSWYWRDGVAIGEEIRFPQDLSPYAVIES